MSRSTYRIPLISLAFLIVMICHSCFDLDLVEKGEVTLTTDWSQKDQTVPLPVSYAVKINNQLLHFSATSNPLPDLLPDNYPVWIYNTPEHIQINGNLAKVDQENGLVHPSPGWLFTAFGIVPFENNTVKTFTVKMQQQVRQLTIQLKPIGSTASKVKAIQAILSGISGTWNFEKDLVEGPALKIPLNFQKQVDGTWLANVRLLGIVDSPQHVDGKIIFHDGDPVDLHFTADLSMELADFNNNKQQPKRLAANVDTHTEAGFEIRVNDWKEVQESGIAW